MLLGCAARTRVSGPGPWFPGPITPTSNARAMDVTQVRLKSLPVVGVVPI